jgi:hypothetical protein
MTTSVAYPALAFGALVRGPGMPIDLAERRLNPDFEDRADVLSCRRRFARPLCCRDADPWHPCTEFMKCCFLAHP